MRDVAPALISSASGTPSTSEIGAATAADARSRPIRTSLSFARGPGTCATMSSHLTMVVVISGAMSVNQSDLRAREIDAGRSELQKRNPRCGRRGFLIGAPWAAKRLAERRERARDPAVGLLQPGRRLRRQLPLDDDVALHALGGERLLEHGAEQTALVRMRADVRVADGFRIDDAADHERRVNRTIAVHGRTGIAQETGDRAFRAALDDLRSSRDLAPILHLDTAAIVMRLARFRNVGVAERDDAARDRRRVR